MVLYTLYTLIRIYISVMQIGYIDIEKNGQAVLMTQEEFNVAGEYAMKKERLSLLSILVDYGVFVWWILGGFAWLSTTIGVSDSVVDAVVFLFGFMAVGMVVGLPFDIYKTFWLDKEYGFTKTTPKLYALDQLKEIAMTIIIGGVVIYALAWIVVNVANWWIWGFALLFSFALFANIIYPTVIVPIFNKLTPLEESELKTDIETMMQGVGLKSDGIFVLDASKRDSRLNAYFAGLGKSKRVVLFDTLIEKLNNKELLAVLGHELGHFSHGDIWKNIGMIGVLLFLSFFILGNLPDSLFFAMGIEPNAGIEIAMMMILIPLIQFLFTPVISAVSRHNEYRADEFGSELGGKENLVSALMKLITENKVFPKSHPLYSFFYYTHPPVLERLKELGYDASAINEVANPKSQEESFEEDGIFSLIDKNE